MKRPVILIVEDVAVYAKMAEDIFKEDYLVCVADCGEKAVEMLENGLQVSVILLDLIMPGMNGFDFLAYLKTKPEFGGIPVIINTAEGEEKNLLHALELGAIDFITKPYNPEIVKGKVNNVLAKIVQENDRLRSRLKEKDFQLQAIADTMPGGIAIYEITDKVKIVYYNDGYCRLLGYVPEEYRKTKDGMDVLDAVHPDDIAGLKEKLKQAVKQQDSLDYTYRVQHKSGIYKYLHISAMPYYKDNSVFANAVLIDVSSEIKAVNNFKRTAEDLRYQSRHDRLTGIYNHQAFYSETEKLIKLHPDREFVLVYLDINHFKVVNDLLGMEMADEILIKIANSMLEHVNQIGCATCCRNNTDRFTFCIPVEHFDPDKLTSYKIIEDERISFRYRISFTYGIYYITDPTVPIMQMCDRAALAMSGIKGKANYYYVVYDEKMREKMITEQQIVSEMRKALRNREFQVYLQPIYSGKDNKVVSAEALVRWIHPQKGIIPPGDFIPLFEKNGFVVDVDRFVRTEIMNLIAKRTEEGKAMVPVSVNISRVNFYNENFCVELVDSIAKNHIDNSMIKFEITESAYTENPDQVLNVVEELKNHHLKVMMDDFGSGYSSLNMLKEIPVDILKIDMRFLQDLETSDRAANIVGSVIEMSRKLDIEVVAEGVETKGQRDFLMENGCDSIQGYYYSRPLPIDEFLKLL